MSATLRALLCTSSLAASLEWRRLPLPPPSRFDMVASEGARLAMVTSSSLNQRYRMATDPSWNPLPEGSFLDFCWDRKCLSIDDERNPEIVEFPGLARKRTFGGIGQATSGTLLWRIGPYRAGRMLLVGYHTAKEGQAIFLGLDTTTSPGDTTLVWRRLRSPDTDTSREYRVNLIGNRIYFRSSPSLPFSAKPSRVYCSADSGRSWSDLGFEATTIEGSGDTVLAITAGPRLTISVDGGRSWDSSSIAPREIAGYKVLAGRLWMYNHQLQRLAWSTDLGRSWIECPGARSLPQFDGIRLWAEGATGILESGTEEIRWKPESGDYATDAFIDAHPFQDGFLATTGASRDGSFRLIQRALGSWKVLNLNTETFQSGRSAILAWRRAESGGATLERSVDGVRWLRVDTLGSYWEAWHLGSDENDRFSRHAGNGIEVSEDGGTSWTLRLPEKRFESFNDYCHPVGFDRLSRPLCVLETRALFRWSGGAWIDALDSTGWNRDAFLLEGGSFSASPEHRNSSHRYRDSILDQTDSGIRVVWKGGSRGFGTLGEPAGVRFAAWVPRGESTGSDSILLVQDSTGNLWEGRESPTRTHLAMRRRDTRVRLEGKVLLLDLKTGGNLRIRTISPLGQAAQTVELHDLGPGIHRIPVCATGHSLFLDVVAPGIREVVPLPGL